MAGRDTIRIYRSIGALSPLHDGTGKVIGYFAADNNFEFSHFIDRDLRDELIANQELERLYEIREDGANFVGYTKESAHGQSRKNSPASITAAEMQANVGLSRFRDGEISPGRQKQVAVKVKEFGDNPPWRYVGREEKYAKIKTYNVIRHGVGTTVTAPGQ